MYGRFMPSQASAPDTAYGVASSSRPRSQSEGGGTGGARSGGKSSAKASEKAVALGKKAESSAQKALATSSRSAAARRAAQQRAAEARTAANAAKTAALRAQMQRNKAAADAAKAAADAAKAAEDAAKAAEATARAAEEQARKDAEQAEKDRRAAAEQAEKDRRAAEDQARKDADKAAEQAGKADAKADGKATKASDEDYKRAARGAEEISRRLRGAGSWAGASIKDPKVSYRVIVGRGAARIIGIESSRVLFDVKSDLDPVGFLKRVEDVLLSIVADMRQREKVASAAAAGKKDETASGAGGGTGSGSGASTTTVSWAGAPYLMEIAALVGWTGASSTVYGVSYAVREVTLDGIAAPAIDVVSASGTKTVTPNMPEWFSTATEVLTAKASGVAAAAPGAQGTTTVTQQQISGQDYLPTGEGMDYPSEPSGGRDEADRLPSSGEMIEAPEGQGVMAFVTRNKWWILGGAAAYVLAHRSNPAQFPLPDALSKMVK